MAKFLGKTKLSPLEPKSAHVLIPSGPNLRVLPQTQRPRPILAKNAFFATLRTIEQGSPKVETLEISKNRKSRIFGHFWPKCAIKDPTAKNSDQTLSLGSDFGRKRVLYLIFPENLLHIKHF